MSTVGSRHVWTPPQRAVFIAALTIVMGSLFLTTYTLALGDPVPHRIDAALVGDSARHPGMVEAVEQVTDGNVDFTPYGSVTAARRAIDRQRVYAALDLTSARPTLYVASADGISVRLHTMPPSAVGLKGFQASRKARSRRSRR